MREKRGKRMNIAERIDQKKEVADKLAKLRTDFNEGTYVKRNDVTVQVCRFRRHKIARPNKN